jgi:pimeloyl-ACP methyl ester carboxylesterase
MMPEPLVLLPGMMCDARQYFAQITALGAERCVTVAPVTQDESAENIAVELLDTMPAKFALFGSDLGSVVAMEMLRRAPERVTRIGFCSAFPMPDTSQVNAEREPFVIMARAGRFDDAVTDCVVKGALAATDQRLALKDALQEMARSLGPDVFVRQTRLMQRRRDHQGTLRRSRVPAMVICGTHVSEAVAKRQRFLAGLLQYAEFREIDGAANMPMLENPDAMTEALRDWLNQPLVLR